MGRLTDDEEILRSIVCGRVLIARAQRNVAACQADVTRAAAVVRSMGQDSATAVRVWRDARLRWEAAEAEASQCREVINMAESTLLNREIMTHVRAIIAIAASRSSIDRADGDAFVRNLDAIADAQRQGMRDARHLKRRYDSALAARTAVAVGGSGADDSPLTEDEARMLGIPSTAVVTPPPPPALPAAPAATVAPTAERLA